MRPPLLKEGRSERSPTTTTTVTTTTSVAAAERAAGADTEHPASPTPDVIPTVAGKPSVIPRTIPTTHVA